MTDDQLQKITWELSLEDHDAFQPVEPSSKAMKNLRLPCNPNALRIVPPSMSGFMNPLPRLMTIA